MRSPAYPRAKTLVGALQTLLPAIGQAEATITLESAETDLFHVGISGEGVGVNVGYVEVKTLGGKALTLGYRVYTMHVHPGSRWVAPEEEDVTVYEGTDLHTTLVAVAGAFAARTAQNIIENLMYGAPHD